jgi:hypothetical protein
MIEEIENIKIKSIPLEGCKGKLKPCNFSFDTTKTDLFIYPSLELENSSNYANGKNTRYITSFLGDTNRKMYMSNNHIFCLYKLDKKINNYDLSFIEELTKNKNYVLSYYIGPMKEEETKDLYMVVFSFPKKYINDIQRLLDSNYSKVSSNYRNLIEFYYVKFNKRYYETVLGVINKSDDVKEYTETIIKSSLKSSQEYWDELISDREYYNK